MTKAALAPAESDIIAVIKAENLALKELVEQFQSQIDCFWRRLFGETSEKGILPKEQTQEDLLALLGKEMLAPPAPETEAITYERKKPGKSRDNTVIDAALRFHDTVPVETIHLPLLPEAIPENRREMVSEKEIWCLAQHPASYVILRYVRPVIKEKPGPENPNGQQVKLITTPAPVSVLDGSCMDVSSLARGAGGQVRLPPSAVPPASGAGAPRGYAGAEYAEGPAPIVHVHFLALLLNRVLVMDETPIKVNRKIRSKIRHRQPWPLCDENDKVVYWYTDSRMYAHEREFLGGPVQVHSAMIERFLVTCRLQGMDFYTTWWMCCSGSVSI